MATTGNRHGGTQPVTPFARITVVGEGLARNRIDQGAADRSEGTAASDWWFNLDPAPRFVVDGDGYLITSNPAGETALADGKLLVTNGRVLKFGSAECDVRFLESVRQASSRGGRSRAILRQRHGGWFAVDFNGAPGEFLAVVGLKEEMTPSPEAMAAMAKAFLLTSAELDVLQALLGGDCPKSAAIGLRISEHTVRAHLRAVYAKTNARGLSNMILLCCNFM